MQPIEFDQEREKRNGFTEVIYCSGKEIQHLIAKIRTMQESGSNIFGTRCDPETAQKIVGSFPHLKYDSLSRTFVWHQHSPPPLQGTLSIVAAGTSDIPVAEEAFQTAMFYGCETRRFYDVGIAGLHRLLNKIEAIKKSDVVIVVAGMEGALPSVLGGLISLPIISCPTSVGYGANFNGFTTLAAMLNSCSEGISVVNIDNGFGATCAALRILRSKQ